MKQQNRIKNILKIYSVFAFAFVISIPAFLVLGDRFSVESQVPPQACSGEIGSGQSCSGNPGVNNTWSCLPDGSSSSGYSCQRENAFTCTYTTSSGSVENCNCSGAVDQCRQACVNENSGRGPGTYQYYNENFRCAGCGQIVGCDCTINPPADMCPYSAGQVQILFNYPGETSPRPASAMNLICGQTVEVGIWDTSAGSKVALSQISLNGNFTGLNSYTLNTTNNGSNQTFNFAGRIQTSTTGFYNESQCRPEASITCRPPNIVESCPYNRVDLQFSRDGVNFSTQPPQLVCGEMLYTRVYETSTSNLIGRTNANMFMTRCQNGNCGNEQLLPSNSHGFTTQAPGPFEYRFRAQAFNSQNQPFTEANCNAFRTVSCQPPEVPDSCDYDCTNTCEGGLICHPTLKKCRDPRWPEEASCRVDYPPQKTVENIESGTNTSRVTFRVELRNNTQNTSFTTVPFRDTYNPAQLILRNPITGIRVDRNGNELIRSTFSLTGRGTVSHPNLATVLGILGPGETYVLLMNFDATSTGYNVCNNAEWNPNDYGWRGDSACLDIRITPPDTDL